MMKVELSIMSVFSVVHSFRAWGNALLVVLLSFLALAVGNVAQAAAEKEPGWIGQLFQLPDYRNDYLAARAQYSEFHGKYESLKADIAFYEEANQQEEATAALFLELWKRELRAWARMYERPGRVACEMPENSQTGQTQPEFLHPVPSEFPEKPNLGFGLTPRIRERFEFYRDSYRKMQVAKEEIEATVQRIEQERDRLRSAYRAARPRSAWDLWDQERKAWGRLYSE